MVRTGCIYSEIQRNRGRGGELSVNRLVRGVGLARTERVRWVAEIYYHGKRYRFRSTNYDNVRRWLADMLNRLN